MAKAEYNDGYEHRDSADSPTQTQPVPVVTDEAYGALRTWRINVLSRALIKAEDEKPPSPLTHARIAAFERALTDVMIDAVLDRTTDAIERAVEYAGEPRA
jgi:hypothetical protein